MVDRFIWRLEGPLGGRPMRRLLAPASPSSKSALWSGSLSVSEIVTETPSIRTFRLVSLSGQHLPFTFQGGQYLDLQFDLGGPVNRSYSISSSSSQRRFVDLTIKREPNGLVTSHLFDNVGAGTILRARGPLGLFTVDTQKTKSVVLIGSGVGVTPLVSIVRSLSDLNWKGRVHALFGFRQETDGLFVDELKGLAADNPKFQFDITWSQPTQSAPERKGRITPKLIKSQVDKPKNHHYFICGPNQMMSDVRDGLIALRVPEKQIHIEAFAPAPIDTSLGGTFDISFEQSGKKMQSEPGESILGTAERAGVPIDYSCRTGTCGLCVAKLLSGQVDMLSDDALEEDEIERGLILTCQSYPNRACRISE